MNGPLEVQAQFGTSLTVTNTGPGMVIRSSALDPIPWGGVLNLTAVPEAGYFFGLWGNAARGTINPLDFIVTNANPTVAALFLPLETNQVTLTALVDDDLFHSLVEKEPGGLSKRRFPRQAADLLLVPEEEITVAQRGEHG